MLSFVYYWIFLLVPLPWLVRYFAPPQRISRMGVRVPFGKRLRACNLGESLTRSTARKSASLVLPIIIWLLLLTAAARPQWLQPPITRDLPTRDLLLLVDLSGSMQAEDFTNAAGEKVDRLTAVKEVLGDFLVRREGDRVGLVVFGDAPFLQAPFSTDLNLSRQLLDETAIGMAGPRTAFGDAIGLGVNLFEQSDAPAKTIIALTDGNDTKSQVPPIEAARIAEEREIRIHTVAIGDPTSVGEEKLDEETLRSVAQSSGGSYFFAGDREQLAGIYDQLDQIETREVSILSYQPRSDLFFWPLLLALLISFCHRGFPILMQSRRENKLQPPSSVRVDPITGKLEIVQ